MKCGVSLQLILNISLLFGMTNLFISEISGNDNDMVVGDDLMSSDDIKPISYEVVLTLNEAVQQVESNIYFSGQCNIEIEINSPTDHITLHAQKQYVIVYNAAIFEALTKIKLLVETIVYDNENHVKIYVSQELHGRFLLKLYFNSFPSTEELFKISYANETGHGILIAATHLRPTRTRALFPCWDNLQIMETFNIIIKLKGKYTALSNMPKSLNTCTTDTGEQVLHFRSSEMSMYDIGIAIFDKNLFFDHFSLKYRPDLTNHLEFAQTIINNVTQHLKTNWDSFLKFQKEFIAYHVAIPGFPHEGMMKKELNIFRPTKWIDDKNNIGLFKENNGCCTHENVSILSYKFERDIFSVIEEAILYNKSMDPFATKVEVARIVARVVVHERLNSVIHPNLWSSLWLNEGIAMLLGQDIVNQIYPDLRILDLFVVQFHQESLHLDTESSFSIMESIIPRITIGTSINELFSFSHYIKAPVILYMFQRLLTSEVFWKGIKIYLNKPMTSDEEFRMTSLDDFCTAMQAALIRAPIPETQRFDIRKVMYSWVTQTQYPVVNVTRITHSAIEYFSQIKIANIDELNQGEWYLPITITVQSKLNYNLTSNWQLRGNSWLKRDGQINFLMNSSLSFNKDEWEIINLQQIGYYRVKYDAENWQKLARYLNSDNYTNIHVLNRAQIIDDAFHFLMKDQIDLTIFLDLTKYLFRETDYIAWYPMIKNLEYMSSYFPYEESTFIKEKFKVSLKNLLGNIGFEGTFENIDNCLKEETAKWACVLGCSNCKNYTTFYLRLHVSYNYSTRVLPWEKDWKYCKGLMLATYTTWKEIFDTFLNETDNEMLKFLACSEHPIIIHYYMDLINNNKYIHALIKNKGPKTFVNIFHSIVERRAKNTVVLEYILNNFDLVIPSVIGTMVALTDIINHVYSIQHLDKIQEFLLFSLNIPELHVIDKLQARKHQIWKQKEHLSKFMER